MMFIIFIIITYTRDKNCQLTFRRWKVLLNNLAFLWWGGGGGGGGPQGASFLLKTLAYFRPRYVNFPTQFHNFRSEMLLSRVDKSQFRPSVSNLLKESTESNSISSANGCSLYPFSHQNVFFQKKKLQKWKKTLWRPNKGSPPLPLRGPQSF